METKRYSTASLPALEAELTRLGYTIYTLDGAAVTDKQSFFTESLRSLPLGDANEHGNQESWAFPSGWDAFSDFLHQGMAKHGGEKVALIWQNADVSQKNDAAAVNEAIEVIEDVAGQVDDTDTAINDLPVDLSIFLLGIGNEYITFDVKDLAKQGI